MKRHRRTNRRQRKGAITVLAAFLLVALLGFAAFALDLGYLAVARNELQRTADAAAMAACWELIEANPPNQTQDLSQEVTNARSVAVQFVASNKVCNSAPAITQNVANSSTGDVVIGYMANPTQAGSTMTFGVVNQYNAVQVLVQRSGAKNGDVPYFFGGIFGVNGHAATAQATAAVLKNFSGFQAPSDGSNTGILPYALDKQTWDAMLAGTGQDSFSYNPTTKTVTSGSDGVLEVNLFPQGTGSPGNRGTVDIGGANNSTADIARQIVDGISPQDFQALGKPLTLSSSGTLSLNGDTGISAGVKDELASIIGQPRIIPIFSQVTSPGNNADYTIVQFAGVRIVEVVLTGKMSSKRVMIQPAKMVAKGGIPSTGATTSYQVYSPVWLVR